MSETPSTSKGIPLLSLSNVADITQVNSSLKKIDELISTHVESTINKSGGVHGIRYDEEQSKLMITTSSGEIEFKSGSGDSVPSSQLQSLSQKVTTNESNIGNITRTANEHIAKKIHEDLGVHGIRYDEDQNKLMISKRNGEEIEFSGNSGGVTDVDRLLPDLLQKLKEIQTKVGK